MPDKNDKDTISINFNHLMKKYKNIMKSTEHPIDKKIFVGKKLDKTSIIIKDEAEKKINNSNNKLLE